MLYSYLRFFVLHIFVLESEGLQLWLGRLIEFNAAARDIDTLAQVTRGLPVPLNSLSAEYNISSLLTLQFWSFSRCQLFCVWF